MYYCDSDFVLFLRILNAIVALGSAIIIAWKRHGEPEPKPLKVFGVPIVQVVKFSGQYMEAVQYDDVLRDDEKEILRTMLKEGAPFSFLSAQSHGIRRESWNRIRRQLVKIGTAEYKRNGGLLLNLGAYSYLDLPSPSANFASESM